MNPEEKKNSQGGTRLTRAQRPAQAPREKQAPKRSRRKKNRPKRTPRQQALHILFLVVTVIAALIVALFIAYKILVVKPEIPNVEQPDAQASAGMELTGPKLYGDRKEEFYTFLVVGRDTGGGGNTDTIMVMSYDIPNQKLNVLNIPRDTMVNVPWDVKKVNSVYNWAANYDRDGIEFLKEEISYLIGFQPDFTMVVEWEAVGELVDAIGPVWFDVPYDMNYDDGTQDLYIHLEAGYQEIDGDKAMQLLRWRKNNKIVDGKLVVYGGYLTGDLGRIQTQQEFLRAVIETCLANLTIDKIPSLAQIFFNNVDTRDSLTVNNLAWFAQEAILGGLSMDNVNFMTLPCEGVYVYSRTVGNNQSYVIPIQDQTLEMINTYFNPYLEDIRLDQLDLMSVNADGSLSSTSGHVEDTYAAKPQNSGSNSSSGSGSGSSGGSAGSSEAVDTNSPEPSASTPSATPTPESTPAPETTPVPEVTPTPAATPESTPQTDPAVPEIGPGMEPVE